MRYPLAVVVSLAWIFSALVFTGCPPDPKANARLQFYNDSTDDYVRGVYLRRSGYDDWGTNLIVGEILPGESRLISNQYPGTYSIKIALRTTEGYYYGMIPEETFELAPRATREFRFARGTWEIGPLTY